MELWLLQREPSSLEKVKPLPSYLVYRSLPSDIVVYVLHPKKILTNRLRLAVILAIHPTYTIWKGTTERANVRQAGWPSGQNSPALAFRYLSRSYTLIWCPFCPT